MARKPTPAQAMRLAMEGGWMMIEAQRVIAMRLMGIGGLWWVTAGEDARMVREKGAAAVASAQAMAAAMKAGKSPAAVALAGLKPVRAKTRTNAARLSKRGPKFVP